jgi:hypothetical protein
MTAVTACVVTWPPRVLGLVPLAIFIAHWHHHWQLGTPTNMWWMCGVSPLVLAFGLFARVADAVRVATVAFLFGLPLWLIEILNKHHVSIESIITHVVSLGLGLWVMSRVRASRSTWWKTTVYFLAVQQCSRWFTSPELNVNISHHMRDGWDQVFTAYWQFWVVSILIAVAIFWVIGLLLMWRFSPFLEPT